MAKLFTCADCKKEYTTNETRESLIVDALERRLDPRGDVVVVCEECFLKIEGRKAKEQLA